MENFTGIVLNAANQCFCNCTTNEYIKETFKGIFLSKFYQLSGIMLLMVFVSFMLLLKYPDLRSVVLFRYSDKACYTMYDLIISIDVIIFVLASALLVMFKYNVSLIMIGV